VNTVAVTNAQDHEILDQIFPGRLPPRYKRANAHEENKDERYRDVHTVEIWGAYEDLVPRERLRHNREYRPEENGERGPQEEQVIEYERAFPGKYRVEPVLRFEVPYPVEEHSERKKQYECDEA
jgi:hypothetical protein